MIIKINKMCRKQIQKLLPAQQKRLKQAVLQFQIKPNHPDLYNHPLTGQWKGHRSISFGGDWRVHYKILDKNTALFVAVGTHSQLYR